ESYKREFQAKSKRIQQQLDQLEEFFRQKSQASPLLEEVIHDVSNSNLKDQCITDNHLELNFENQQELGSENENELNIIEDAFDQINIGVDI
ncbi:hypothetical protein J1N35_037067, partial [Gossypium stocksii]